MRYLTLLLINLLLLTPVASYAEDDVVKSVAREGVRAAFLELERQAIREYFGEHPDYGHDSDYDREYDSGHKSKKKGKGLPPGIQKKLARGGTLPPGIAKQYLPHDLDSRLPPPPHGYERTIYGSDVLLVEVDTGRVADIVADVIVGY